MREAERALDVPVSITQVAQQVFVHGQSLVIGGRSSCVGHRHAYILDGAVPFRVLHADGSDRLDLEIYMHLVSGEILLIHSSHYSATFRP